MDFALVIVQGRSATNTLKLGDGVTTIGRHDDCQLRIKSSQVSRKHCELFEKKGLLLVKDLGSANGTLVNGKRVQGQRVLEDGDELTIGPVQLRVMKLGATTAAPGKPAASPGDTAVTAPVTAEDDADDFLVDFDEPTVTPETKTVPTPTPGAAPKGKAPAQDDDAIADFLMDIQIEGDEETLPPSPAPAKPAPAAAKPATKAESATTAKPAGEPKSDQGPEKEKAASDDAIADFLLDIKLDEEE